MTAKYQQIVAITCLALVPLAFTGCFVRSFGYSFDYSGTEASRSQTGNISLNTKSIEVTNRWGNVSIQEVNSADTDATWTWSGATWGTSDEDAETFLAELDMIVTESDETMKFEIVYPKPSSELRGIKSHLTLQVPQGTSVTVKNRHGESIATGMTGITSIDSSHGDVTLKEMMGPVSVDNNHGKTHCEKLLSDSNFKSNHGSVVIVGAEQKLSVVNNHGSIKISDTRGNVTTKNSHGSTTIETSQDESVLTDNVSVSATNNHGSIKITLGSPQVSSIFAENNHGSINLFLPKSSSTKLDLKTRHGGKKSEFQHDPSGDLSVKCRNNHGSIKIRKK